MYLLLGGGLCILSCFGMNYETPLVGGGGVGSGPVILYPYLEKLATPTSCPHETSSFDAWDCYECVQLPEPHVVCSKTLRRRRRRTQPGPLCYEALEKIRPLTRSLISQIPLKNPSQGPIERKNHPAEPWAMRYNKKPMLIWSHYFAGICYPTGNMQNTYHPWQTWVSDAHL